MRYGIRCPPLDEEGECFFFSRSGIPLKSLSAEPIPLGSALAQFGTFLFDQLIPHELAPSAFPILILHIILLL